MGTLEFVPGQHEKEAITAHVIWMTTRGMPGITPRMMSSSDGLVAEVIATESPSQPWPEVIQMTWAVTASFSCWPGTNSTVPMDPPLNRSAAAGRRRAGP